MILKIKPYTPHEGQKRMHQSKARFRIACCGRRFGKTFMGVHEIVKFSNINKNVNTMWISPTYKQSKLAFDIIIKKFKGAYRSNTKNPMQIVWFNGSITKFSSAESGDTLRGDSLHLVVVDEASMVDEEVWTNVLRPMLSDTDGKAIIISTPKGINSWFHTLFTRGQDPEYPDYESFKFQTADNPYIPPEEIEEVRNTLPSDVFKQEYLAEFLEDGGQVFSGVQHCISGDLEEPIPGRDYICAWDCAKHSDFSVLVVIEKKRGHVVAFDRFNRIDYKIQVKRLEVLARKYKAHIIMDSTGVGDPLLEQVKSLGLIAEGYQFTNTSKQQLIEHLAVLIEKKEVTFPNIKVLTNELMSYQYEITRAGNMRYNAPSGMHDDAVIALALAAWGAKHQRNPSIRWLL
jgi:hypothetical protein